MDPEVWKVLFQTHHAQLTEKRRKIHAITERTAAILIIVIGWLVLGKTIPPFSLRLLLILVVLIIVFASCYTQYKNSKAYQDIALVIRQLNDTYSFFEEKGYCDGKLYPNKWKKFGKEEPWRSIVHHWVFLFGIAVACVLATILR